MADPLEQGIAALREGDKAKARHLLSLAVQQAPRSEKAWIWLSGAMESDEDRMKCLKRVLSINPANEVALRGVAELEKRAAPVERARPVPAARAEVPAVRTIVEARRRSRRPLEVKTERAAHCASCGAEIAEGQDVCAKCTGEMESRQGEEEQRANLPRVLLAGLLAAVVASAVRFTIVVLTGYLAGYLSIAVGAAVGAAIAAASRARRGRALQAISVVLTLAAVILTEYLIVRYVNVQAHGAEAYPLIVGPGRMVQLIVDGISSSGLTAVYWLVALLLAFLIPARRPSRQVQEG